MLNYVMLFGKIKEDPVLIKDKNNEDIINLEVEVPYKDGAESELITVKLTNGIAQRTMQDLHKGDKTTNR